MLITVEKEVLQILFIQQVTTVHNGSGVRRGKQKHQINGTDERFLFFRKNRFLYPFLIGLERQQVCIQFLKSLSVHGVACECSIMKGRCFYVWFSCLLSCGTLSVNWRCLTKKTAVQPFRPNNRFDINLFIVQQKTILLT